MPEQAIVVEGVSKTFRLYRERNASVKAALMRGGRARYDSFSALSDISLQIPRGSTFGLMGVNGSGKSTLLKCIANILRPDTGTIMTAGKVAALLELGSGFHPELSGRENVYLNGSILGLTKRQLDERYDQIVDFAGVRQFIDQPVKNYSSGMYVRLGFSVAINVDPDVLLVDEVLAVGDLSFQEKCMAKFVDMRRRGKTVVIVSHALDSLRQLCDEVAWLEHGRLLEVGAPGRIIDQYIDVGHGMDEEAADSVGPGRRWGSGEAVITDLAVLDAAGVPTTQVPTGEEITIRIRYDTREPVPDPVFGLTLWTAEGIEVWSQHTADADRCYSTLVGPGEVTYRVPSLMTLPGAYDLSAAIVDRSLTYTYDFHRYCYPFRMTAGSERVTGGLVGLGGEWAPSTPRPSPVSSAPSSR